MMELTMLELLFCSGWTFHYNHFKISSWNKKCTNAICFCRDQFRRMLWGLIMEWSLKYVPSR